MYVGCAASCTSTSTSPALLSPMCRMTDRYKPTGARGSTPHLALHLIFSYLLVLVSLYFVLLLFVITTTYSDDTIRYNAMVPCLCVDLGVDLGVGVNVGVVAVTDEVAVRGLHEGCYTV